MTSASSMYEAGHSKLVLWDNPKGWGGEEGGAQDGETCAPVADTCHCMTKSTTGVDLLFCSLAYRVIITSFLNSIYMRYYTVLEFFFLTYFALYNRLQFQSPHYN